MQSRSMTAMRTFRSIIMSWVIPHSLHVHCIIHYPCITFASLLSCFADDKSGIGESARIALHRLQR